ncbi:flagellar motor switch protein FliN/FliY [Franzmannia pantelleriensis]|uniref:Flagellar motor switch protein FliN n=1 Tax=Franzmannia pantelleriensis TaxID=48727 RepID=A0A1G9MGR3_9GAMM|nr:flagellar motor switch protein FliN [Halomonas pantelleriensis]SDL73191.1 flagellar motor switch protein FliN/FliY [Halomonas pantelleriensis]
MTDPTSSDPNKPDQNATDDDWASAMAEQGDAAPADDDPWAEALAEQAESEAEEAAAPDSQPEAAGSKVFKPLDKGEGSGAARDLEMVMDIPVKLSVELGRTRITIKQLLELAQGSVIELDGLAGEPMDILINGYLIAQGEVVVVDDKYGIRVTEIITPSERVQKLNR